MVFCVKQYKSKLEELLHLRKLKLLTKKWKFHLQLEKFQFLLSYSTYSGLIDNDFEFLSLDLITLKKNYQ